MPVPKKHTTRSKVGRRRSHHALKPTGVAVCKQCKAPTLPHRVCGNCGTSKKTASSSTDTRKQVKKKKK